MHALGGGGGLWGWKNSLPPRKPDRQRRRRRRPDSAKSSGSAAEATGGAGYQFPLRQAATAGSLALAGDTIAQLTERWRKSKAAANLTPALSDSGDTSQDMMQILCSDHDWVRALRMASYGFLLYGPGSYAWYQYLDRTLVDPTVRNIVLKVILNQVVLGPSVIAIVFAWNLLWQGKFSQLPNKYQKDALPTLLYGFRFWIPVSVLNFWAVPLQARVAFMSMCSIFWNFCLSSVLSK